MAAVHNNNSSNSDQRNGTVSPGGWHFPKSGLGTPDLFYSFSGGSSSSAAGNAHHGVGASSSSNAPSWFKPQGASQGNNNVLAASSNSSKAPASSSSAAPAAVKSEEPDGHADDDARASAGNPSNQRADNAGKNSKDNTGNEEANRTQRALSDPPVRQSPAWIFPAAGFGPHKTHLEQEPNPFEHSFSRTDSDPSQSHSHHAFAQAVNASNAGGAGAGPGGNAPTGIASYNNGYPSTALMNCHNGYEIGPPRRARSQSPKSAGWQHSGITASHNNFNSNAYGHADSSSFLGANLFGNSSKGAFSTPSSELPSFGWAFDNQALGGGGGPGGNGATGAAGAGHHQATSNAGNSIFDPTSIRTGLTPGGIGEVKPSSHLEAGGGASNTGAPHSPATQALFAMMTNATPGAEVGGPAAFAHSAGQHKTSGLAGPIQGLHHHQASLGNDSRASSSNNSSSNSIPQLQQQSSNDGQQGMYSQAVPRPMHLQGSSQFANTQQPLHSSYHTGNPNYLQQNMPRPLPPRAFDSTQSSEASSSQSIPQLHNTRQHHQGGAAHRPVDPNPLYLLSQHAQDGQQQHPPNALPPNAVQRLQPHQQQQPGHLRHSSDQQAGSSSHNEDAMLAAAALSGLSTPRPAYVGGPAPTMPSVNPGNINSAPVPNLVQPPLGRTKPIPPPANLFHEQKPPSQQQQGNTKGGNKKGATGGGNKRKKGATATPEPSGPTADDSAAASSKAKVRRTSRRTAASTNLAEPESGDEIEQKYLPGGSGMGSMSMMDDDDNNDGQNGGGGDSDDDDDMMSNNGSQNGSRDGGGLGADGQVSPPRKGGRGPKQHFATEEEKRKNFLERNRQAALKCRQRKKQWLTQLQSKVEYLTADNETLQATVARLREEVASLRAVLGVHVDCQMNVPPGPGAPAGGVMTVGAYLHGVQQQQAQGHPHYQQQHPHRQHQ